MLRLMDLDYLLVRWDSNVLETAHSAELAKIDGMLAGARRKQDG